MTDNKKLISFLNDNKELYLFEDITTPVSEHKLITNLQQVLEQAGFGINNIFITADPCDFSVDICIRLAKAESYVKISIEADSSIEFREIV